MTNQERRKKRRIELLMERFDGSPTFKSWSKSIDRKFRNLAEKKANEKSPQYKGKKK